MPLKEFLNLKTMNFLWAMILNEICEELMIRYVFFSQDLSPIVIEVGNRHRPNIHPSQ